MFPKYLQILDIESIFDIRSIPLEQLKVLYQNMWDAIFYNKYSFIGNNYYKSKKSNVNDSVVNATIIKHYFTEHGNTQEYSTYQLKYLKKIVALCKLQNIQLIIINTPIHSTYFNKIPKKFITNYYTIMDQLNSEVSFYDLHSFKLKEACYGDGDHLNIIGAKILSKIINEKINRPTVKLDSIITDDVSHL